MKTGAQGTRLLAIIRKWGPILAIALLMIVGFVQGWHRHVSLDSLVSNRDLLSSTVTEHYWLMLGGYGLLYIAAVALSFPGASLLTIAGGFLFGWLIGGMITVVSATLGASLVFLAARSAFGGFLRERAGGFADRFSAGFREDGFNYLLFLRLVPLFPFWLVNVMPALFNLRLGPYATGNAHRHSAGDLRLCLHRSRARQRDRRPAPGQSGLCHQSRLHHPS